jgi:hypothetical protein
MKAVIITFNINSAKFKSTYERNKFYKQLYGWKQTIKKEYGTYSYENDGILNKIPHIRVSKSLFIIPNEYINLIEDFFKQWEEMTNYKEFIIFLRKEDIDELINRQCKSNNIDYFFII